MTYIEQLARTFDRLQSIEVFHYMNDEEDRIVWDYRHYTNSITAYNNLVSKCYDALINETNIHYMILESLVDIEYSDNGEYGSSIVMLHDINVNKHLRVYTGGKPHPYLKENNLKFRAVHDYFGHAVANSDFSFEGELRAYLSHSSILSPLAQAALATEVLGSTAWYYENGETYAPQKAIILPKVLTLIK